MLIELMNKMYQDPNSVEGTREAGVMPLDTVNTNNTMMIKRIVPERFKADIDALENYVGQQLQSGICINVGLTELLTILPRERRRIDAYNALKKYLHEELGVELNITSRKNKKV